MTVTPDVISVICDRIPSRILGALIRENHLPNGKGKESRINNLVKYYNDDKYTQGFDNLFSHYVEHLLYGNKVVVNYGISHDNKLNEELLKYQPPQSRYSEAWPLPVINDLKALNDTPVLCHMEQTSESLNLVFCSVRVVHIRESFKPDALGEERPTFTNEYDEIIGIRPYYIQCFDVISLTDESMQIRLDYYKAHSTCLNRSEIESYKEKLIIAFNEILESIKYTGLEILGTTNYFPSIKTLEESNDGVVAKLSQTDNQGCDSTLSRRKLNDDVRDAIFYSSGKAGVEQKGDNLKHHSIKVRFPFDFGNETLHPELIIDALPSIHQIENKIIDYAIIKGNLGKNDFAFVYGKLNTDN